jgi:uncharacterized Zn finger protein
MYFGWKPYVPVAARRRRAERKAAKLKKNGRPITPVTIEGRTIAASFWGKSWCTNLERYSDYASRLPRGRTYVRNGSVIDLQIANGEVTALVAGSELYTIKITIAPVKGGAWKAICRDCSGSVSSLVELLQGSLSRSVMDRVCREGDGLFPSPKDIELSCSCPDWASMCKHVAAALYGVGARLDSEPELLFVLRGVDQNELLSAEPAIALSAAAPVAAKLLDGDDVAALFGLEMAGSAGAEIAAPAARTASGWSERSPAAMASARGAKDMTRAATIETSATTGGKPKRKARATAPGNASIDGSKKSHRKGAAVKAAGQVVPRKGARRGTARTAG